MYLQYAAGKTRNVEERRQNVIGIFSCLNEDLFEKKVLLIDDVTTSGATLNACAASAKEDRCDLSMGINASQRDLKIVEECGMDLQITGQSIEILPTVKDYIEKKFGKLDRHFQNINGTKVN